MGDKKEVKRREMKYCCKRMEFFIKKGTIIFEDNEYHLIWNDWDTDEALDQFEQIYVCPFCRRELLY